MSRKHKVKVLEAALSIPSHEAQKWREGVVGRLRGMYWFDNPLVVLCMNQIRRIPAVIGLLVYVRRNVWTWSILFSVLKMEGVCYSEKFVPTYQIT